MDLTLIGFLCPLEPLPSLTDSNFLPLKIDETVFYICRAPPMPQTANNPLHLLVKLQCDSPVVKENVRQLIPQGKLQTFAH